MQNVAFPYRSAWQTKVVGPGGGEPYLFHLRQGKHRIRMEVTLGDIAPILRSVESNILELNAMYRKIISYTGTVPDTFRDYNLEQRIPEMTKVFRESSEQLEAIAKAIEGPSGQSDERTSIIHTVAYQLKDMADKPETVPSRVETFKTNVGALSSWMLTVNEQPLALDYLIVSSPGSKLPEAQAGAWKKLVTGVDAFFASFYEDYDDISSDADGKNSVSVWVTSARDQAQVIKRLVEDQFTPQTGIQVNLKLVASDVILPSNDAPERSSRLNITDEEIPFFQIALHGYFDIAGAPYNMGGLQNPRLSMLKSLETGSTVYYQWFASDASKVKDTDYNHLYALNYKDWIGEAAELYKESNRVLAKVRNQVITAHVRLAPGVVRTTYANGLTVTINYNRAAVAVDGLQLQPQSYHVGGE
jgi:hypothetical protein